MGAEKNNSPHESPETVVECSHCGYRFVGQDLADKPCPNCGDKSGERYLLRPQPKIDEPVVEIYRAPDWLQAEMIRETLESQDILVAFRSSMPWGIMTFTVDGAGEVAILALQSDADRARQIVEDYLGQLRAEAPSESDTEE
jgi:hypothetical protein